MKSSAQTLQDRIVFQQIKLAQLKARKAKLDALEKVRKNKEARSAETRRKILVGSLLLSAVERGEFQRSILIDMLDNGLDRNDDRNLFNLPQRT